MPNTEVEKASHEPNAPPMTAFITVWLTLFVDLVAFGIIIPVLPYYAEDFGASAQVVTLLATAFSLAQFVMAPVLGRLSDRYGRRPVMLISIAGGCLAQLVLGFAGSLWVVFLARICSGASNANIATAQAYVADRVAPQLRAKYMGMMGAAIGLGFVFGPALGGLLAMPDYPQMPFLAAAGLTAVNFVMAYFFLPESRRSGPVVTMRSRAARWQYAKSVLRGPLGILIAVNFLFYFAFSAMESTFALLMEARLGWSARETGMLFTLLGVVIIVTQGVLVAKLVRWVGERVTIVVGMLILCCGLAIVGSATLLVLVVVGSACIAAGNGLVGPSTTALISRQSGSEVQGLNIGLASSGAALARVFGPIGAGVLFEQVSPGMPMLAAAGVTVVAAVFVLVFVRAGSSATPTTSPTAR